MYCIQSWNNIWIHPQFGAQFPNFEKINYMLQTNIPSLTTKSLFPASYTMITYFLLSPSSDSFINVAALSPGYYDWPWLSVTRMMHPLCHQIQHIYPSQLQSAGEYKYVLEFYWIYLRIGSFRIELCSGCHCWGLQSSTEMCWKEIQTTTHWCNDVHVDAEAESSCNTHIQLSCICIFP